MSKGVRRLLVWLGGLVVVIILVLPNIHRTGGHGSRIACANNLKQVGIGMKLYADEHDDVYPQKFGEIIQYVSRHTAIFVCAESGNEPESIETVDEWTDYGYIAGLSTTSAPNAILAYCDPKNHNGEGGNILFADGHVEWFNSKRSDDGRPSFGDVIGTIGKMDEEEHLPEESSTNRPPKHTEGASPSPVEFDSVVIVKSPVILKGILGSRSSGKALPERRETTDDAVVRCLRWFNQTQNDDGSWGANDAQKPVLTGFVLLAYLSHGETPASDKFGTEVEECIKFLVKSQDENGIFISGEKTISEHAIVTWAMCEAYGMTKVPMVRYAAESAVNVVLARQNESGLWKKSEADSNIESSIWNILALKSARMAGMTGMGIRSALLRSSDALKIRIADTEGGKQDAPAIYALQLMGLGNDPLVKVNVDRLKGMTVDWDKPEFENSIYYWYFTTQAKFRLGGDVWSEWNRAFVPVLMKAQVIEKCDPSSEIGFWVSPDRKDRYGKIYTSALCCLMFGNYSAWQRLFYDPALVEPEEDEDIEIKISI